MIRRKQSFRTGVHPPIPIAIDICRLAYLRTSWKCQFILISLVRPIPPSSQESQAKTTIGRIPLHSYFLFFFERVPANKVSNDDASLSAVTILETDNDHAVAARTFSPTVHAVFSADATRDDEFMVAAHADIVVAGVAFETVVACI